MATKIEINLDDHGAPQDLASLAKMFDVGGTAADKAGAKVGAMSTKLAEQVVKLQQVTSELRKNRQEVELLTKAASQDARFVPALQQRLQTTQALTKEHNTLSGSIGKATQATGGMALAFVALRPVLANVFGPAVNDLADMGNAVRMLKDSPLAARFATWGVGLAAVAASGWAVYEVFKEINKVSHDIGEETNSWSRWIAGWIPSVKDANAELKESAEYWERIAQLQKETLARRAAAGTLLAGLGEADERRRRTESFSREGIRPSDVIEDFETARNALRMLYEAINRDRGLTPEELKEFQVLRADLEARAAAQQDQQLRLAGLNEAMEKSRLATMQATIEARRRLNDEELKASGDKVRIEAALKAQQKDATTAGQQAFQEELKLRERLNNLRERGKLTDKESQKITEDLLAIDKKRLKAVNDQADAERQLNQFRKQWADEEKQRLEELARKEQERLQAQQEAARQQQQALRDAIRQQAGGQGGLIERLIGGVDRNRVRRQLQQNLLGPINDELRAVTEARRQRAGQVDAGQAPERQRLLAETARIQRELRLVQNTVAEFQKRGIDETDPRFENVGRRQFQLIQARRDTADRLAALKREREAAIKQGVDPGRERQLRKQQGRTIRDIRRGEVGAEEVGKAVGDVAAEQAKQLGGQDALNKKVVEALAAVAKENAVKNAADEALAQKLEMILAQLRDNPRGRAQRVGR